MENVAADSTPLSVSACGGVLTVVADAPAEVFDASGKKVAAAADGHLSAPFATGIYFVRSGSATSKVAVR